MQYKLMWLVVGLGNPGKSYENNRHNIGYKIVDQINIDHHSTRNASKWGGDISKINYNTNDIILVKPTQYMNKSGQAVSMLANYYHIDIDHIIVIYDDIDMPLAQIRYRRGGSTGGHNGIKDIIRLLGSPDFHRIKIGVDRPTQRHIDIADRVLSDLSSYDISSIMSKYIDICNILDRIFASPIDLQGYTV